MAFRVGQKVVCVERCVSQESDEERVPQLKQVYTIRDIFVGERGPGFLFEEIHNPPRLRNFPDGIKRTTEFFWGHWRFAPLIIRKTDISIFTALLTPNKRERADA